MSEYIEIATEIDDETHTIYLRTNLVLSELGKEQYKAPSDMEVGSPLAQFVSQIEGLRQLTILEHQLIVVHDPSIPSHAVASETASALREFFL